MRRALANRVQPRDWLPLGIHLFTYGSLAVPVVMRVVTGRTYHHTPARIRGFERFMLKGRVYPGITETGSGETDGRVYFDLDEDALARLDFFEADEYDRACLRVELDDDLDEEAPTEAFVYVIPRGRADLLSDE